MKLIIDALGGDNAPSEIIKGAVEALADNDSFTICFTGPESVIRNELSKYQFDGARVEIVDAPELITMDEHPVEAIKKKRNSSLVVGLEMLKAKQGDAFITAGSTGATLAGAQLRVGRIRGIIRPALAPVVPNAEKGALLIDCGANMDCKPANLAQFALMGSIYMKYVIGVENPRVGLASVGVEDGKGNELSKAAFALIKEQNLVNFIGNAEGRDIVDRVDVMVTDGFDGNLMLKSIEGLGGYLMSQMKKEFLSDFRSKMGALLLKPALKRLKKKLDYAAYGGAPLLGIDGVVIKAHGSSNAKAIKATIAQAISMVNADIVGIIKNNLPREQA